MTRIKRIYADIIFWIRDGVAPECADMPKRPVVRGGTILCCQVSFGVRSRTHESLKLEAFRANGGTEASRIQVSPYLALSV